jgi:hypothetical protein
MDHRAPTTALRRKVVPLALSVALAAAGCGEAPPADPRSGEVIRVIGAFADADGAQACELLTQAALERLYGGLEGCVERSESFEGGEVKVEEVEIDERGDRATAQARSLGGRDRFTVTARLIAPPGCGEPCPDAVWRVSEVKVQR